MREVFSRLLICIYVSLLVLFMFKLEIVVGLTILKLEWLLPLVSAISACMIYSIKTMLSKEVVAYKIFLVFFTSMTLSSFFFLLGIEIYCLSFFLPLFELCIWNISYYDINYCVLYMDDVSKGSPSKINTIAREPSPDIINPVDRLHSIYGSVKELTGINNQLGKFTKDIQKLKDTYDIKVVSDTEGNLDIDVPNSMSSDKASELSKRVGVIDRLISSQYDKFDATVKQALEDKEYLIRKGHTFKSGFASIDRAIFNHDKVKNVYKSLQDKD